MKRLFYCEDEGEFYFMSETPKILTIEWVANLSCDSEKIPLDHRVHWKQILPMKIKKDNQRSNHCLKKYDEKSILVYPQRAGLPFYLELATQKHIDKEIEHCKKWGVSIKYYLNLIPFLSN